MPAPVDRPEGRRRALIVAASAYTDGALTKLGATGRDARELESVLADPAIGGFEVDIVRDATTDAVKRRIANFCKGAQRTDLALIYLSCHGMLDEHGHLHYAMKDTEHDLLAATAIEASWLNLQLQACRCRRKILILDCCHSGAFARRARGASIELGLRDRFPEGRGLFVLTASGATEQAFNTEPALGRRSTGMFTSALVEGLRSGDADGDGDGEITVGELFDYAERSLLERGAKQRPRIWVEDGGGKLVLASSPKGPRVQHRDLPAHLIEEMRSTELVRREAAVAGLAALLLGDDRGYHQAAREVLERMVDDDAAKSVVEAARAALRGPRTPARGPLDWILEHRRPIAAVAIALAVVAAIGAGALSGGGRGRPATVARTPARAGPIVAPKPVEIGALYPASDINDQTTRQVLEGVDFARDYIDNGTDHSVKLALPAGGGLPGLHGAKIDLHVVRANRCDADAKFRGLVGHDHVSAVLGAYESTLTLRALVASHATGVPLLNDGSTAPSLTRRPTSPTLAGSKKCTKPKQRNVPDPRPSRWFFRVGPSDDEAAGLYADFIAQAASAGQTKIGKIAILHETDDILGNTIAAVVARRLHERLGIPASSVANYPYTTLLSSTGGASESSAAADGGATCSAKDRLVKAQMQRIVGKLRHDDPDILFEISYGRDGMMALQTMNALGYTPKAQLVLGSQFLESAFLRDVAKQGLCGLPTADPAGIIARSSWAAEIAAKQEPASHIAKLFSDAHHGEQMGIEAATGFNAMMTLARAVSDAGSRSPAKVRQELASKRFFIPGSEMIMPWKGVHFGPDGENVDASVVLEQVLGGQYHVVYPSQLASRRAIWPLKAAR